MNPQSAENKQLNSYNTVNTSTPNPSRHKKRRKMQQKDIIEKPSIKTWVSICAGAVAGFLLEPSNRHLTWKRKRESSARRTYSPHPQRSRTSKKQVLLADPAAICTKKEKKQVSEGCLLLGFFFRVFGGGHVAGEEGAAGGVAAVPVGTITVSLAIRTFRRHRT
jgi:hypothetical protein